MTIQEKLEKMLIECGLFEKQAKEIIERVKNSDANDAMEERWSDRVEDYPEVLLSILWLSVKHHALEWIDENCPLAWFRLLFAEKEGK